jgi:hypothetical protein
MSNIDRVKEKALQRGVTPAEFVEAMQMASEFNLTHNDPVGYADLMALADKNRLALDIYGAVHLDRAAVDELSPDDEE